MRRIFLFCAVYVFFIPAFGTGQLEPSSSLLDQSKEKTLIDAYKRWLERENQGIPPDLKAKCEIYERDFLSRGDSDEGPDPSKFFAQYPDNLMKPLAVNQASKLNIPAEMNLKSEAKQVKLYLLRQLSIGSQTILIADYSDFLGGPDSRPVKLKNLYWSVNPWSDALDIYLQTGTGNKRIAHWEGGKRQAHLFRMDKNSPLFIYIHEQQEKPVSNHIEVFQRKESLYRLKDNGNLEKMIGCGDLDREGNSIFVYDFGRGEKMVVASETGALDDPDFLKSLHETYPSQPSAGYSDIVLYKWDGKKFIKMCRYYLASGE